MSNTMFLARGIDSAHCDTLVRVDKNGTEHWVSDRCPKCGGSGYIEAYDYVEGGICFKCEGTGEGHQSWKVYTPEYATKLEERRIAKLVKDAPEANRKVCAELGASESGEIWAVLGNTFEIKDALKAAGAKYNTIFGWHFASDNRDFPTLKLTMDELWDKDEFGAYGFCGLTRSADVEEAVKNLKRHADYTTADSGAFLGEVGDKLSVEVTLEKIATFETHYTYNGETNRLYIMKDADGNTLVWKTNSYMMINDETLPDLPFGYYKGVKCRDTVEGEKFTIKGTVKELTNYRGTNQTVLTRCKVI